MSHSRYSHGWDDTRFTGITYGSLHCSKGDIEGDVKLRLTFDDLDAVARMDLLRDWIGMLERERDILSKEMYGDEK